MKWVKMTNESCNLIVYINDKVPDRWVTILSEKRDWEPKCFHFTEGVFLALKLEVGEEGTITAE